LGRNGAHEEGRPAAQKKDGVPVKEARRNERCTADQKRPRVVLEQQFGAIAIGVSQRALDESLAPGEEPINPELIDIAVQAGTALEWAPIAIGGEPEIERAGRLIRSLFDTASASGS